jgi:hypothetical protein
MRCQTNKYNIAVHNCYGLTCSGATSVIYLDVCVCVCMFVSVYTYTLVGDPFILVCEGLFNDSGVQI